MTNHFRFYNHTFDLARLERETINAEWKISKSCDWYSKMALRRIYLIGRMQYHMSCEIVFHHFYKWQQKFIWRFCCSAACIIYVHSFDSINQIYVNGWIDGFISMHARTKISMAIHLIRFHFLKCRQYWMQLFMTLQQWKKNNIPLCFATYNKFQSSRMAHKTWMHKLSVCLLGANFYCRV